MKSGRLEAWGFIFIIRLESLIRTLDLCATGSHAQRPEEEASWPKGTRDLLKINASFCADEGAICMRAYN